MCLLFELVKNEENNETMITQALHLDYSFKFQTTISLQCPIYYSQNDNLVFTVSYGRIIIYYTTVLQSKRVDFGEITLFCCSSYTV